MEILKVLIERILGWPVVCLVLAYVFRRSIRKFLKRVTLFKGPGIEVNAPTGSASKQKLAAAKSIEFTDQLIAPSTAQRNLPLDVETRRQAAKTWGGDGKILLEQIRLIDEQLRELHFEPAAQETTDVLVRHLSVTFLALRVETAYRLIFGSQIRALQLLNSEGPQPKKPLETIFNRARARSPKFYGDYSFDSWIGFLLNQNGVRLDGEQFTITEYGQEFLKWMIAVGAPKKMH